MTGLFTLYLWPIGIVPRVTDGVDDAEEKFTNERVSKVTVESKEAAIEELAKRRNLVVDSFDGENVWMAHREEGMV